MWSDPILVASATATTGAATVKSLVAMGVPVRAMVRQLEDPRSLELASLPGVTLVQGNFDDLNSIASVLEGISRCLLVSSAFAYEQFERETLFLEAAAHLEVVVRVSTASFLMRPGTKGAYGRTHYGIEAFSKDMNYPVVHLNPNWFLTNWMGNASEAKSNGTITMPCSGNGPRRFHFLDPRDVGDAAAKILTLPSDDLKIFLDKKNIEIHGPQAANYSDVAAALSKAVGYPIVVQQVPREAFISVLMGFGIPRVFATSFVETMEAVDGITPPGYPANLETGWEVESCSPELLAVWQPKYTVDDWANSEDVKAAFGKD
jgi:uncharacterized protein YbjT (DUF2867 family)